MSDFYQLTSSTSDFKSRSNDIFDKLTNLEKQHDVHTKTNKPLVLADDETPASSSSLSSSQQNPTIPTHAITFKKRPADDTFSRPTDKWQRYDLDDVNEHHMSAMGNRHALNDFFRTRTKPSTTNESNEEQQQEEAAIPPIPIFKRPAKKEILTNADDEDDNEANQLISMRVPTKSKVDKNNDDEDDNNETKDYKLKSIRKQPRGVLSTTEKKPTSKLSKEKTDEYEENDDDDDEDVNDEFFEP